MRTAWLLIAGVTMAARPAAAQPERSALAERLRAFEEAWEKQTEPAARKRALAVLPKATTQFLTLQLGEAGRTLDLARSALASDVTPSAGRQWVASLTAVAETRLVDATAKELVVTVEPLYAAGGPVPKDIELQLWFTNAGVVTVRPTAFPVTVKVPLPPPGDSTGLDRRLYFAAEGAKERVERTAVVSQVRDLRPRLAALKAAVAAWPALDTVEKATARDRLTMLTDLADGTVPEMGFPAAGLLANAETMLDGKPFFTAGRPGEFWLSVPLGGKKTAPVRVFVPRGLDPKKPVPVVVALHGAGGSENLFFEGYGRGRIVTECRERGWVLVATRSGFGFASTPPVPEVLAELAKRYPLDLKRAFLVGHSMGAVQTVELLQKHPGTFAAAAALGGGGRVRAGDPLKGVPVFVGVGAKDFALSSARLLHKALADGGAKATLKEYPDVEHMAVVREALADVFAAFDAAAR